MNETYDELLNACSEISKEWRKYDDDCTVFNEIVCSKTKGLDLSYFGEISNLIKFLEEPHAASLQTPSSFSDLYIQLFNNGRFHVEVLNWWGSDINIHDHDFAGVQIQLKGSSLNIVYKFEDEERKAKLARAPISVVRAEVWNEGDRSLVLPGDAEPHIVFHLNVPTVSLLIRTRPTPEYGPQRNYFPPGIAGSYGVANTIFRKRLHALKLMSQGDTRAFHESFFRLIDLQSPHENLFTLIKLGDILFEPKNAILLSKFAGRGEVEKDIAVSAVFRRANDFLTHRIKSKMNLSLDEQLSLSVLAGSHDSTSLSVILQCLQGKGIMKNFEDHVSALNERLDSETQRSFSQILKVTNYSGSLRAKISA